MTESYSSGSAGTGQGQGVAQTAQTAVEQGRQVVRETGTQARNLIGEAGGELRHQASTQQKRAAEGLRALGSQLNSMARGAEQPGVATDLVHQAASRAQQAADWLEHREPGQILDEVRDFARRRPGVFVAGAVIAGVLVGRLTRSLASGTSTTGTSTTGTSTTGTSTTGTSTTGTTTGYPDTGYLGTEVPTTYPGTGTVPTGSPAAGPGTEVLP